jgi:hypothetical protein
MEELILVDGGVGASCSLSDEDVRIRLREWASLRDRAVAVEPRGDGVMLRLRDAEPLDAVASLVSRESECCPFYTFSIEVHGPTRSLVVNAGPTGGPAIHALLSLDTASISANLERR